MLETTGNLWELVGPEDVLVITTNGFVRKDGLAVMGRGIAYQATQHDADVSRRLGYMITTYGNHVHYIRDEPIWFSFPVKHHWKEQADLELIERSTRELVEKFDTSFMDLIPYGKVYMPRPGCGNGRLSWDEVRPVIEPYLDDRFIVVSLPSAT